MSPPRSAGEATAPPACQGWSGGRGGGKLWAKRVTVRIIKGNTNPTAGPGRRRWGLLTARRHGTDDSGRRLAGGRGRAGCRRRARAAASERARSSAAASSREDFGLSTRWKSRGGVPGCGGQRRGDDRVGAARQGARRRLGSTQQWHVLRRSSGTSSFPRLPPGGRFVKAKEKISGLHLSVHPGGGGATSPGRGMQPPSPGGCSWRDLHRGGGVFPQGVDEDVMLHVMPPAAKTSRQAKTVK